MKSTNLLLFTVALFAAVSASPLPQSELFEPAFEPPSSTGSSTLDAIANFFRPIRDWFRETLPDKTPDDIVRDLQNTANDARDWVSNNDFVNSAADALKPVQNWVEETANVFKEKPLRDIYQNARDTIGNIDETVGGMITDLTN